VDLLGILLKRGSLDSSKKLVELNGNLVTSISIYGNLVEISELVKCIGIQRNHIETTGMLRNKLKCNGIVSNTLKYSEINWNPVSIILEMSGLY